MNKNYFILFLAVLLGAPMCAQIVAVRDVVVTTEITTPQIVVANVLANDYLNNVQANLSNLTLTQIQSFGGIELLPDGSVQMQPSSESAGLLYEICEIGNLANCTTEFVSVRINDYLFEYAPHFSVLVAPAFENPLATIQLDNFSPVDSMVGWFDCTAMMCWLVPCMNMLPKTILLSATTYLQVFCGTLRSTAMNYGLWSSNIICPIRVRPYLMSKPLPTDR